LEQSRHGHGRGAIGLSRFLERDLSSAVRHCLTNAFNSTRTSSKAKGLLELATKVG
jgi:hypothetical protein